MEKRKILKLLTAWVTMSAMLFLLMAQTTFAAFTSITKVNIGDAGGSYDNSIWYDMIVQATADVHIIGAEMNSGSNWDLIHLEYNASTNSWDDSTVLKTGMASAPKDVQIDIQSDGDIGVAWFEWDGATSANIYYNKQAAGTWGSNDTVASGISATSDGAVGFGFFNADGGTDFAGNESQNDPFIATCNHGDQTGIYAYTYNGSSWVGDSITDSGDYGCNEVIVVNMDGQSSDEPSLLSGMTGETTGDIDSISLDAGSGWNGTTSEATSIYKLGTGDSFGDLEATVGGNTNYAAFVTGNEGNTSNTIKFMKVTEGSWTDPVTVVSGSDIGEMGIDIVEDTTESTIYIAYFDEDNDQFYVAYSQNSGTSWTSSQVVEQSPITVGNHMNYATIGYDSSATDLYLTGSYYTGGLFYEAMYEVADPFSAPDSVPEFKTYVYIATLLVAFGLMYGAFRKDGFLNRA